MTPLIAIFSVLVLLGCLRMQLARNPKGAKSTHDRSAYPDRCAARQPCSSTKTAEAQQ